MRGSSIIDVVGKGGVEKGSLGRASGMAKRRRKGVSREGGVEVASSEWRIQCSASKVSS